MTSSSTHHRLSKASMLVLVVMTSTALSQQATASVHHPATAPQLMRNHRRVRQLQAWELPDWAEEWLNETLANTDWESPTAWQDWFGGVSGEANMDGLDVCALLETAVGMSSLFGIAADCQCQGDSIMTGMDIQCAFEQCLPVTDIVDGVLAEQRQSQPDDFAVDNAICGQVSMNMTFGGDRGSVATSVCTDFPTEEYKETCFSYSMSMVPGEAGGATQTCGASYGGQQCDCSMDGFCLNLNCSTILPGAAMDTCQMLSMQNDADLLSWIPQFDMFSSDFELDADMIPWRSMDWENVDWANFNMSDVQWSNEWLAESWSNLAGGMGDGMSDGVCTLMTMAAQLTDQLDTEGSCTCDSTNGLSIECDFAQVCVGETMEQKRADDPICASVNMTMNFDTLGSGIDNAVCMDFFGDSHPETCFSYTIPVADQNMEPTCTATYGEGECACSIDENFCILVDCSEFEKSAVMDTCQIVDLNGATEASRLVLPFRAPEKEVINSETPSGEDVIEVGSSEQLANSASVVSSAKLSVVAIAALVVLSYV